MSKTTRWMLTTAVRAYDHTLGNVVEIAREHAPAPSSLALFLLPILGAVGATLALGAYGFRADLPGPEVFLTAIQLGLTLYLAHLVGRLTYIVEQIDKEKR